jgi:GNAT superfamily N-acetyltransferase
MACDAHAVVHSLRRAKASDADALATLAPGSPEALAEDALTIVAENEAGEISGFCATVFPSRDDDAGTTVCEVSALYVHPERKRWGIGRNLMRSALDKAAGDGYEAVTAWVPRDADDAKLFFASFGFKPDGATLRDPGHPERERFRLQLI